MDFFSNQTGDWALVAGAAEGIGAAFCDSLARRKINLAMIDIQEQQLYETATRIENSYHIKTIRLVQDLSEKEAWIKCLKFIDLLDCRILIYVPAYSPVKSFLNNSPDELDKYLWLNNLTPLHLVHDFAERSKNSGCGGIVLMSSLAGLIGPKYVAPYAATKAFNVILAESLYHELRSYGVAITVCCAGPTSTPTYRSSLPNDQKTAPKVMEAMTVAEYALKQLGRKAIALPGKKNRFFYFILLHVLPRKMAGRLVSRTMGKMYPSIG